MYEYQAPAVRYASSPSATVNEHVKAAVAYPPVEHTRVAVGS
jgi:hypothetical protein